MDLNRNLMNQFSNIFYSTRDVVFVFAEILVKTIKKEKVILIRDKAPHFL